MTQIYDRSALDASISQMESAAMNFAYRFINDGKVRLRYINQTQELAKEYQARVSTGRISPAEAATQVQTIRNQILEAQRLQVSDLGKAIAVKLKKAGLTLEELTEKYAQNKFGVPFKNLSTANQNKVYLEIIDSSGRPRPSMNLAASKYSKLGKGLLVVTLGSAIYNIVAAEDKTKATAREGLIIGGGFAGGAAGGALSGILCGPGAPICVTVGVFIGGALGALGADFTTGWLL